MYTRVNLDGFLCSSSCKWEIRDDGSAEQTRQFLRDMMTLFYFTDLKGNDFRRTMYLRLPGLNVLKVQRWWGNPSPPPPHLLSIITPQRAAHDPRAAISNTKTKIKLKQVKRFLPTLRIELGRCLSNHCLSHLKQYSRKICSSYYNAIYYSVKEIFSCPCTLTTEIFLCWFVFALLVITFALDRRPPKKSSNSRRSGCLDYKLIFVLCVFSF